MTLNDMQVDQMFQPFLRFYRDKVRLVVPDDLDSIVSTLLEILPALTVPRAESHRDDLLGFNPS